MIKRVGRKRFIECTVKLIIILAVFVSAYFMLDRIMLIKSEDGIVQMQAYYRQPEGTVDDLGKEITGDIRRQLQFFRRGEGKAGTAERDESAKAHDFERFAPGVEREEGVHARDEEQVGAGFALAPGVERVDRVRDAALSEFKV